MLFYPINKGIVIYPLEYIVTESILSNFPFLTVGKYIDQEYIGIIGNSDAQLTSIYIYNDIPSEELKKVFLSCGDEWWWETNRQIPINVALGDKWLPFRGFMKTFITKDFEIISGPCTSLDLVMSKRIKKKQIQLVKR